MKQVQVPNSDLFVSPLSLGCWGLASDFHWGQRDQTASAQCVNAALDAGVTLFDTAAIYGDGDSEKLLGDVLGARRKEIVLATKILPSWQTVDDVRAGVEQSLQRLRTDYIDLYQIHWPGAHDDLGLIWETMQRLQSEGKVRYIGTCNAGPRQLASLCESRTPSVNQLPYNLLWRAIELEVLPVCDQRQIGVLAYSPLMHGLLTGRWREADEVPQSRARSRHFRGDREFARHGEAGCESLTFETLSQLSQLAANAGIELTQLALNWTLVRREVVSILVGVSRPEQLRANLAMLETDIPADVLAEADRITEPLRDALGKNADMWQSEAKSRFA